MLIIKPIFKPSFNIDTLTPISSLSGGKLSGILASMPRRPTTLDHFERLSSERQESMAENFGMP